MDTIPTNCSDGYLCHTDTVEFQTPYVKIVALGLDSSRMTQFELEYYMDLAAFQDTAYWYSKICLNLLKTLATERVRYLFTEEKKPLSQAIALAQVVVDSAAKKTGLVKEKKYDYFYPLISLFRSVKYDSSFVRIFMIFEASF